MYYAIGATALLFILALPFKIDFKSFFSLREMSVGISFSVARIGQSFAFSLSTKTTEKRVKEGKIDKKANALQKLGGLPIREVIKRTRIDYLKLNMELGFKDNAMSSVMVCQIVSTAFDAFCKFFPGDIYNAEKLVLPRFNKDICFFDLSFKIRISALEIINLTFVLILKALSNKIRNRGEL